MNEIPHDGGMLNWSMEIFLFFALLMVNANILANGIWFQIAVTKLCRTYRLYFKSFAKYLVFFNQYCRMHVNATHTPDSTAIFWIGFTIDLQLILKLQMILRINFV